MCHTFFAHDTFMFLNPTFKTDIMIAVSITLFLFLRMTALQKTETKSNQLFNKRYYLFLRLALHKTNNKFVFWCCLILQPDKEYHQSQTFRVCIKERLTLKTDRIGKRCIRIFVLSVLSDDCCTSA